MADEPSGRKRRLDGEDSYRRILDAAKSVAGEHGYERTTIALVSKQCGLPASSIYWHFKDKDDLLAAVMERSFNDWFSVFSIPPGDTPLERITKVCQETAKSLLEEPDFLRLGLMLAFDRRPDELRARTVFMDFRNIAQARFTEAIRENAPALSEGSVRLVSAYAMAGADGIFIARQLYGDSIDLYALFEAHARAVYDLAMRLADEQSP